MATAEGTDEARQADVIDRIEQARERWHRLVADVGPDRIEEPGAMGDWTFKDVAAHFSAWRMWTVARLDAAARGEPEPPPPWPASLGDEEDDPINAWIHDQTKDRPAAELLAQTDASYEAFVDAIRALPADAVTDPDAFAWMEGTSLADSDPAGHLVQHELDVRAWLDRT